MQIITVGDSVRGRRNICLVQLKVKCQILLINVRIRPLHLLNQRRAKCCIHLFALSPLFLGATNRIGRVLAAFSARPKRSQLCRRLFRQHFPIQREKTLL